MTPDEVTAVLSDPGYQVPPAPPAADGEVATLAWLRARVARFSEGPAHARRRALAERDLAGLDPAGLRRQAAEQASAYLAQRGRGPFNGMELARRVPLAVLAERLGIEAAGGGDGPDCDVVSAAITAAAGYLAPDQVGPEADAAVATLVTAFRAAGPDLELIANRIALLMQACDATAGLIANAIVLASASSGHASTDASLASTLAADPPVLRTRRLSPDGDTVLVDLTAHPFGTGRRPCPGEEQAIALASGVLDAVLPACALTEPGAIYPEGGNLKVPVSLPLQLR